MGYLIQAGKRICKITRLHLQSAGARLARRTGSASLWGNRKRERGRGGGPRFSWWVGKEWKIRVGRCEGKRAGRSRMSNLCRRVGRWETKYAWRACVCVPSSLFSLFHTHSLGLRKALSDTHMHTHDSLPSSSSLFHLSYSNLKLIFSHSYLPKPTHISPPVSLHFLLSTTEKCDQRTNPFWNKIWIILDKDMAWLLLYYVLYISRLPLQPLAGVFLECGISYFSSNSRTFLSFPSRFPPTKNKFG